MKSGAGFFGGIVTGYIVNFINKLPMNSYIAALKPNYCYSVIR